MYDPDVEATRISNGLLYWRLLSTPGQLTLKGGGRLTQSNSIRINTTDPTDLIELNKLLEEPKPGIPLSELKKLCEGRR